MNEFIQAICEIVTCDTLPMAGGAKQAELQVHFDDKEQEHTR